MENNRRKAPRFKLHQAIEISCYSESFINVKTVDISENGMRFETEYPIEHEAKVFLMFEIPENGESRMIRCEGIVMWQDETNHVGVMFTSLTNDEKVLIKDYVESNKQT